MVHNIQILVHVVAGLVIDNRTMTGMLILLQVDKS